MAHTGVAGFEPTNDGVKVRCLTAWLYPKTQFGRVGDGNRTHEMPEPQSGALTTSPHPPCSTACISIYKKKYFVKIKIKKYFI